jgi:hypothetical protein
MLAATFSAFDARDLGLDLRDLNSHQLVAKGIAEPEPPFQPLA